MEARLIALEIALRIAVRSMPTVGAEIAAAANAAAIHGLFSELTDEEIEQVLLLLRSFDS